MTDLSLFGGTGYIGSTYERMYPGNVIIPRGQRHFDTKNVLYFISTTTNQNVFQDLQVDIDVNLKIFTEFLSHCKRTDTIINFVSSGFVYGNDILDAKETDCCNPTGFYSITKRCAEQLLMSYCETFGIKYRIFRIGNVFGIDPTVSQGKNVLGYMIRRLKNDDYIVLYDGGNYVKDYMHVEDVCSAMNLLMETSFTNNIYNIGTGVSRSFREVIEYAKDYVGSNSELISTEMPEEQKYLQIKNFTMNVDKLSFYGHVPNLTIDTGVEMMCKAY